MGTRGGICKVTRASGGSECSLDDEVELLRQQLQSPYEDELPPRHVIEQIEKMGAKSYLSSCNAHRLHHDIFTGVDNDNQRALYMDVNALYSCTYSKDETRDKTQDTTRETRQTKRDTRDKTNETRRTRRDTRQDTRDEAKT